MMKSGYGALNYDSDEELLIKETHAQERFAERRRKMWGMLASGVLLVCSVVGVAAAVADGERRHRDIERTNDVDPCYDDLDATACDGVDRDAFGAFCTSAWCRTLCGGRGSSCAYDLFRDLDAACDTVAKTLEDSGRNAYDAIAEQRAVPCWGPGRFGGDLYAAPDGGGDPCLRAAYCAGCEGSDDCERAVGRAAEPWYRDEAAPPFEAEGAAAGCAAAALSTIVSACAARGSLEHH